MQQVAASNVPRVLVVGRFNSIHTRRFAEELQRQGVETAALCIAGSTDQPRLSCYQPKRIPRLFGLPKTALVASLFYLRWAIRDFKPDIIHVQDDGVGIPDDVLPHVFELFTRATTTASNADGLGVGLAVVKELAALHGGGVEARSAAEGGTVFTLRLPLRQKKKG